MVNKKRGLLVVVLALLILIFYFNFSLSVDDDISGDEDSGCYYYPGAEEGYCERIPFSQAEAECSDHPDCDLRNYFYEGAECNEPGFEFCEEVICSADCSYSSTRGKCEWLGGEIITEEEYSFWCDPGCCLIRGSSFCQYLTEAITQGQGPRYFCQQRAQDIFGTYLPSNVIFNNEMMTPDRCQEQYCREGAAVASLSGKIFDDTGEPLGSAEITLGSERVISGDDPASPQNKGNYQFSEVNPATYKLKITKSGYLPLEVSLSLAPGEVKEQDFTLSTAEGTETIFGTVKDSATNLALVGARVSASGPLDKSALTNNSGSYLITDLPLGSYTITASMIGYQPEEESFDLSAGNVQPLNFWLEGREFMTITGRTYLDLNMNDLIDNNENQYGILIYLDDTPLGYSKQAGGSWTEGDFEIVIAADLFTIGEHKISATYYDYVTNIVYDFGQMMTLVPGEPLNLLLTSSVGECTEIGTEKNVIEFTAENIRGEEKISLSWVRPCAEVQSYSLTRTKESSASADEGGAGNEIFTEIIPRTQTSYLDDTVSWGETYTYEIVANYDRGRLSGPETFTISVGSSFCAGKFNSVRDSWDSFCSSEDLPGYENERQYVWSCDDFNKPIFKSNCLADFSPQTSYYCTSSGRGNAECKTLDQCSFGGGIFGLYNSPENCYGTDTPEDSSAIEKFCYYDYSDVTIDECKSCLEVKSCFDYHSKNACQIDSCLSGEKCRWVNAADELHLYAGFENILLLPWTTFETGHGYCVEDGYQGNRADPQGDDYCGLCGPATPPSTLFENNFCTAAVCSGLGRCFSNPDLDSCVGCPETPTVTSNCHTYKTELECKGGEGSSGQNLQRDDGGKITLSTDSCGWGRCYWDSLTKTCFKDGDGDTTDDCTGDSGCKLDISPPKTKIVGPEIPVISTATPDLVFEGNDDFHQQGSQKSNLLRLEYCLTEMALDTCQGEFTEVNYLGNNKIKQITEPLLFSDYLQSVNIYGDTYRLKFYSLDKSNNQEDLQEALVFVDNVKPPFDLELINRTIDDRTDLTINVFNVEHSEPMVCTAELQQVFPPGASREGRIEREQEERKVEFSGLTGTDYKLIFSCTDDYGNVNQINKSLSFNLDQNIELLYPQHNANIARREIAFKVKTIVAANCILYQNNLEKALFKSVPNEEKIYETEPIRGFTEKNYDQVYAVVCQELLDPSQKHQKLFYFNVDFSGPQTTIILSEGEREITVPAKKTDGTSNYGWKQAFISSVNLNFRCESSGFPCDKTYYCLGDDCPVLAGTESYQVYNPTKVITLNKTTTICYYSTDSASNPSFPLCGKVLIGGYGLTLEKPELYFYQDEQWGVSNLPVFDWQFYTAVPTTECRYGFQRNFNYSNVPNLRRLTPLSSSTNEFYRYGVNNFPLNTGSQEFPESGGVKSVYVKCDDGWGRIGQEEKLNLEYEPVSPRIISASADPSLIIEGRTTHVFVGTDQKTVCKYNDNSGGQSSSGYSSEYGTMQSYFPGSEDAKKILNEIHEKYFETNFLGVNKNYSLGTICMNGARNFSQFAEVNFSVDYSILGNIINFAPQGAVASKTVTLQVETSKDAFCEYKDNGVFVPMEGGGGKIHTKQLSGLAEKGYVFPVKCDLEGHRVENNIIFRVDLTSPKISEVYDGNYTCGKNNLDLMVYSDENGNISFYYYEVYDMGEGAAKSLSTSSSSGSSSSSRYSSRYSTSTSRRSSTSSSSTSSSTSTNSSNSTNSSASSSSASATDSAASSGTGSVSKTSSIPTNGILVLNGTSGPGLPLSVPISSLNESHNYVVRVRAADLAGNWGDFTNSDGFKVVPRNDSVCKIDDSLSVEVNIINKTCSEAFVELHCQSKSSCSITYGQHATLNFCQPDKPYTGSKLSFKKNGWLCYHVEDSLGTSRNGSKLITVSDADADGIFDDCDLCTGTSSGRIVDGDGCAGGQEPDNTTLIDTDGDGLPDKWEKYYSQEGKCELNYGLIDSDQDGINDGLEDYDQDGYSNYQEYLSKSNPCLADAPPSEENKTDTGKGPEEVPEEEPDIFAWTFLILGILLVFGGSGYLIYFYKYTPQGTVGGRGRAAESFAASKERLEGPFKGLGEPAAEPVQKSSWKDKLFVLRKRKEKKLKAKRRKELFGTFSQGSAGAPTRESTKTLTEKPIRAATTTTPRTVSAGLPHFENIFAKKTSPLSKVQEAAEKYVKHKEEIKPTLKPGEKSVFARLEDISKKTKQREISQIISKKEAGDIFSQLKDISKKRKLKK